MVYFTAVGTVSVQKDTDKVKGFETKNFKSGWEQNTLNWSINAGGNRIFFKTQGGHMKNNDSLIYVFGTEQDEKGNNVKLQIPFSERKKFDLSKVQPYNKYRLDFGASERKKLTSLSNNSKSNTEKLNLYGFETVEELENAIEKTNKLKKEYLSQYDYAVALYKLLKDDKYKDQKFMVRGTVEFYTWDDEKGEKHFGKTFVPNQILTVENGNDEEEKAIATVPFLFADGSVEEIDEEKNRFGVNGYVEYYNSQEKQTCFAPYHIFVNLAEKGQEHAEVINRSRKRYFDVEEGDESLYMTHIVVNLINGSQKRALRVEDLSEELQDALLIGDITMDDLITESGDGVYGPRVEENVFVKLFRSAYKQATNYTADSLIPKKSNKQKSKGNRLADNDDDVFDLDDDDDDIFGDI